MDQKTLERGDNIWWECKEINRLLSAEGDIVYLVIYQPKPPQQILDLIKQCNDGCKKAFREHMDALLTEFKTL